MRKWTIALALVVIGASASDVRADGIFNQRPCTAPYCNHNPGPGYQHSSHRKGQVLPVFQAAPWYLYWPYDAHFMTPAPLMGAYYAPPAIGNYPVQPYFPNPQAYGYNAPPAPVINGPIGR